MFHPITSFILHYLDRIHMPDARDLFSEATELAEQGQLDEALAIFQALLKTDSNTTTIWNNIGIVLFRQGKYREAMNAFSHATDIDPQFGNAWFNKSLALMHLGKDTEALRALDNALKLNPRDREALSQRALIVWKIAQVGEFRRMDSQSAQSQLRV
jgi:tetratricopeptide (TPR) repeat protein